MLRGGDGHLQVVRGAGRNSSRSGHRRDRCGGGHACSGCRRSGHRGGYRSSSRSRRGCRGSRTSGRGSRSSFCRASTEALEGRTGRRRSRGYSGVLLAVNHADHGGHASNQQQNNSEQSNNRHDTTTTVHFGRQNGTIFRHTSRIPGLTLRFTVNSVHAILGIYILWRRLFG